MIGICLIAHSRDIASAVTTDGMHELIGNYAGKFAEMVNIREMSTDCWHLHITLHDKYSYTSTVSTVATTAYFAMPSVTESQDKSKTCIH